MDKKEALEAFAKKVEVVIQCCNERELYAVLERTEAPQLETEISFEKSVRYPCSSCKYISSMDITVGTFADKKVAVICTDQGNGCMDAHLLKSSTSLKMPSFFLGSESAQDSTTSLVMFLLEKRLKQHTTQSNLMSLEMKYFHVVNARRLYHL